MSGNRKRLVGVFLLGLAVGLVALPVLARPGGGQTYSGSSSSRSSGSSSSSSNSSSSSGWSSSGSGSSSSSGGGDMSGLIVLLFENPPLALLVFGVIGAYMFFARQREASGAARDWTRSSDVGARRMKERMEEAGAELERTRAKGKRQSEMRAAMEGIAEHDPNFSVVLFEDFLSALYAEAPVHRGRGTLGELGPWIAGDAHQALAELGTRQEVSGIVIGAMRYRAVEGLQGGDSIYVRVEIEANYSEGADQRWYTVERWSLARKKSDTPGDPARFRRNVEREERRGPACSVVRRQTLPDGFAVTGQQPGVVHAAVLRVRGTKTLTCRAILDAGAGKTLARPEAARAFVEKVCESMVVR
ncbi:MAG: hypothetical protein HYZ29_06755 [Myxococcales bacterium]|nr:hypothetical protein [Myxococcales bacterium]